MHGSFSISVLPPRTSVEVEMRMSSLNGVPIQGQVGRFTCIDCQWTTEDADAMLWHQENQRHYHTRWQRFKRVLSIGMNK